MVTTSQDKTELGPPVQPGWLRSLSHLGWLRAFASLAIVALHLGLGHSDYGDGERFLAGAAAAILVNVIWTYFAGPRARLPVIEWVLVQLYVFFAMPVFSEGVSTLSISFDLLARGGAIRDALLATNVFIAFMLVGWAVVPIRRIAAVRKKAAQLPLVLVLGYGVASLVVTWFLNRYEIDLRYAWYRQVLWVLFLPATAQLLLLFEYQRQPGSGVLRGSLIGFTALMVLAGLLTSRLGFALMPLVTAGIGVLAMRARIPKTTVFFVVVLLVVVNPAKHVYRELTGYRTADFSTQSLGDLADAWVESMVRTWSSGEDTKGDALDLTSKRLNSLTANAAVFAWVPSRVAYAKGEPWLAVPYSFVPRVLWPAKPGLTEITNDRFAVTFGMSTWRATARTTSAYPSIADGYWNFGWLGIGLSAFLAGLFWKVVSNAWSPNSRYRYVLPFFLLIDASATEALPRLLVGVLQTTIASLVVIGLLEVAGMVIQRRHR